MSSGVPQRLSFASGARSLRVRATSRLQAPHKEEQNLRAVFDEEIKGEDRVSFVVSRGESTLYFDQLETASQGAGGEGAGGRLRRPQSTNRKS